MEEGGLIFYLGLTVLLYNCGNALPVGGDSACETTGTVFEGESATVTCHFQRPHQRFMVYKLSPSNEREIITACTYTENGPNCDLLEGQKVTAAKDQAILHIASAEKKSSGKYFCKTLPASEDNADYCTLVVQSNTLRKGNLVTCKANEAVSQGEKSWLSCGFSKAIGSTGVTLVKESEYDNGFEEEIVVCDAGGQCTLKTDGYMIEEKTEDHVKVSIPELGMGHAGKYKCRSATLKGIEHGCQLKTKVAEGRAGASNGEHIFVYAILGSLVALVVVLVISMVLFCVYRRFSYRLRGYAAPQSGLPSEPPHGTT